MSKRAKTDPLRYENALGAQFFGDWSYRMRYDVVFARNVYTISWLLAALAALIFAYASDQKEVYYYALGGVGVAALTFVIYPVLHRYDIGATVAYCRRRLGENASDEKVRACVERREENESIKNAVGDSWYY